MAYFNIGDTVRNIFTNQKGKVEFVHAARRGLQLYKVFYSEDNIKDENENDLEFAVEIRDLFDRCLIGAYDDYSDFLLYNTTFKIDNSSNNMLSSIKASKTMFKTYQYIPLMKFLTSDLRRLLIADEVGLGKTIEAGHIMLEMKARGELKNVLVVCPKALVNKWQDELFERFGLMFEIYGSKEAVKQNLKGQNGQARGIITYEGISDYKPKRQNPNETKDEKEKREKREKQARERSVLNFLEQNNLRYSLVVCDEAHHVRNMETARRTSIERLLQRAEAAIFLTATPIMLGRRNLFSLLNLLNSQRYSYEESFESELKHVEPLVWAVSALNANLPFSKIKDKLDEAVSEDDYIRTLSGFSNVMELLGGDDNAKQRTLVQSNLYDINPLSSIMSRTRKVDVTTDLSQATRDTINLKIQLHDDEQEWFDDYQSEFEELDPLSVTTRQRQVASSVYGFEYGKEHWHDNLPDAKFEKLLEIIRESQNRGNGKVIVFVSFKNTIRYLAKRLENEGVGYRTISGDDKTREDRVQTVEEFRTQQQVHVLLSTEVGGEGLDMQFCNTMVNYDLPWNPMVVEQRIGRIDRIGQQAKVIHIYTMIVQGTIQEKIHDRLLSRIEIFRQTIGDLEPILSGPFEGSTIEEAIEDLYRTELSQEELDEKMRRIERALERNLEDSRKLEKELSDSFTSDAYLRDHLNKIIRNNAYVTEQELENYVRCLFRDALPTCSISPIENGVASIVIPRSDSKSLVNFLYKYTMLPGEAGQVMQNFANAMRGRERLNVTFNQEVAEENRNITFLNIYHPFVIAAKENFYQNSDHLGGTFRYSLPKKEVPSLENGYYLLGIYDVKTTYQRYGKQREVDEIHPVVYDIRRSDLVEDINEVELVYSKIQKSGIAWSADDTFQIVNEEVEDARVCMNQAINDYCNQHRIYVGSKQQDDIKQQQQGENARFSYIIQQQKDIIEQTEQRIAECNSQMFDGNGKEICIWDYYDETRSPEKRRTYEKAKEEFERVLPAMKGRLKNTEEEHESRQRTLANIPEPIVSNKIMMLNLIHIV